MISFVTPLMKINYGLRRRNWNVVRKSLMPLVQKHGYEWIAAEQGSTQGNKPGVKKVSAFGKQSRSSLMNIGWKHASNDIICFMDADIVHSHESWESIFAECMEWDCYSPYTRGWKMGSEQTRNRLVKIQSGVWNFPISGTRRWNLCGGICFMKRHLLEEIGGWDNRFTSWGYEDIAMESLIKKGGWDYHYGYHIALHLWHGTGHKTTGNAMRRVFRRHYAGKSYEQILKEKLGESGNTDAQSEAQP